ncbi:RHS repeat protein [Thiothrix eikelboomii]|nr:RHS repeat protein [Thiothrix eikelboomii]
MNKVVSRLTQEMQPDGSRLSYRYDLAGNKLT